MRRRRVLSVVLSLVALTGSMLLPPTLLSASAAAAAPVLAAAPLSTAAPAAEPGPALASLQAADGELVGMRTRSSRTYPSADGRVFETRVFDGPVNYRDSAGAWQRIDPSLQAVPGGGFGNAAADFDVAVPPHADGPIAMTAGEARVAFRLLDATAAPAQVDGPVATYSGARAGVDLQLQSTATGFKETLVLTGPDSPATSVFAVELSAGLGLVEVAGGGLRVVDALGRAVFVVPAPFAVDSALTPDYTDAVRLRVGGTAVAPTVAVELDPGWLADPTRVFPVLVDPSTEGVTSPDATYIDSGAPTTNYHTASGTAIKAGGPYRALFHFDVAAELPRDITLLTSDLRARAVSDTGTQTLLSSHVLTSAFSGTSVTWNARTSSAAWTSPGGDFGPATETDEALTGSTQGWVLSEAVRGWLDNPGGNRGMILTAGDGSGGVVEFAGRDQARTPFLSVNWVPRTGLRSVYSYDEQDLSDTSRLAVNVASGNLTYSAQDLALTGPQLSLNLTRTYNSMAAPRSGSGQPLPQAWALSLGRDVSIGQYADGVVFAGPTGESLWFKRTSGSGASSVYASPPGANATLTRNSSSGFELQMHQPYLRYVFHHTGVLQSVRDSNGNELTVGYDQNPPTTSSRATTLTDVTGRTQSLTYDSTGRLTSLADGAFAGTAATSTGYGYDSTGYLSSVTDRAGHTTTYGYGCAGAAGRLCTITDPRGHTTTIGYDSRGRVTSISRPLNDTETAVTAFAYTLGSSGGTTVVTDANNGTTTYTWDANSQVTGVQDPLGHARDRTYTANGDVKTITGATVTGGSRATTTFSYDENPGSNGEPATNNLLSAASPTGAASSSRYDGAATGAARYLPKAGTDSQDNRRAYTYSAAGNLKTESEADSNDQPVTGGASMTYKHHGEDGISCGGKPGALCQAIDGRGKTTSYSYGQTINGVAHARNELTTVTPPAPLAAQSFEYDAWSRVIAQNVVRTAGQAAERRTFTYDKLGRDLSSTYPGPSTITFGYDGNGNVTSRTDATGTTSYTYDRANRLLTKTIPGDTTVTLTYDKLGNLLTHTAHGDTITYTYDAANRLIRLVEPGGNCDAIPKPDRCTRFTYDDDDRRLQTLYPNDVVQTAGYDPSGRQTKAEATGPSGLLDSFAYGYTRTGGADGNLRSSMTHKARATDTGLVTNYSYDTLNRLTGATAHQDQISADSPTAWWKLDETAGTAADATGTGHTGTYDTTGLTRGVGGGVLGGTIPATGTPTDRLALRVDDPTTSSSGRVVVADTPELRLNGSFSISLWVKITAAPSSTSRPGFLTKGSPHLAGGGYEMHYSDYDADGKINANFKMNGNDAFTFGSNTLTVGQWHHLAVTYDGNNDTAGTVRTYLDGVPKKAVERLLGANNNDSPLHLGRNTNGSNATVDDIALFKHVLTADQIDRQHRAALADATYTYDHAGNRTAQRDQHARSTDPADNMLRWTHNDANQITSRDSTTTGFSYDGYGNTLRTLTGVGDQSTTYNTKDQATSWAVTGGSTQQSVGYAGASHQERLTTTVGSTTTTWTNSPLGETSTSTGSGSSLVSYVRDPGGQLIGIRVGTSTNATRYYFTFDGLGSITGLTDSTGARVNTYRYDPYGQILSSTEGLPQPFRYTGGIHDSTTGLTKLGIRYYDPNIGRFTQPDPTGQDPHYTYAANSPITLTDPTGACNVLTCTEPLERLAVAAHLVGIGVASIAVAGSFCAATAGLGCVVVAATLGASAGVAAFSSGVVLRSMYEDYT